MNQETVGGGAHPEARQRRDPASLAGKASVSKKNDPPQALGGEVRGGAREHVAGLVLRKTPVRHFFFLFFLACEIFVEKDWYVALFFLFSFVSAQVPRALNCRS